MVRNIFSFVLFSLFGSTAAFAQIAFTGTNTDTKQIPPKVVMFGKVTDAKTGEPLPGASVYIADDRTGTYTDANGKYSIRNIPTGHHVVEVSYTGYSTLVEHVELTGDVEKDFTLSSIVVENQGVVVTGVAGATSIRKIPVPISSIRRSTLLQSPSSNIIDALTHIPGVSQLSTGPAISK
ncbi:MAG TPA: carboxypeptidase-like regulatory domain-containing protein, partial [Chitinophagaceae bacterium]|nr:carboxypeptidase-like regulatory domain-containing protein [Chitinophagaceae bacterium]